ncbi:hypothetical protein [Bradyrhizobium paxllaeri]|uniref:hypothetical protein n=1 Tax=Bradyrhizobium paxllaeri TaxID=190148 RepID=UPI00082769C3|nr:hypothetical protein [Bradyrhizobium paxllaeri]
MAIGKLLVVGATALSLVGSAAYPALAQEKLVGTYGEVRTVLSFKVTESALQKFVPAGWQSNPVGSGPSKGANVLLVLIDAITIQGPDGKPEATGQGAVLVFLAKKTGTEATAPMVFAGFVSNAGNVPGAYGAFELAKATVARTTRTDPEGRSSAEESWDFSANDNAGVSVQLQFGHAPTARTKVEARIYSAKMPDFYRIYRIEQAIDVVRSSETGVDRVQKVAFKIKGSNIAPLFDGSEKLVSIASIPWYTRQVSLPSGGTQ